MKKILMKKILMKKILMKKKKKNTHTIKLIFKTYKKADKIYFNNVFSIYKNVNRILSKTTNFQRRLVEYIYNYSAM